jgi:hypothetical protein
MKRSAKNLQVIASPDGDIAWVSGPLPGAVHDLTAARIWGIIAELAASGLVVLADKGPSRPTAPKTHVAGIATEHGRGPEVDPGGGVEPCGRADGQAGVGGTEVIDQPGSGRR